MIPPRPLAIGIGVVALLVAIAVSPVVVGPILATDGQIDSPSTVLLLRAASFGFSIAGLLAFATAVAPEHVRLVIRSRELTVILAILALAVPTAIASLYAIRNHTNPLAHLEMSSPIAKEIAAAPDPYAAWHEALIRRDWPRIPQQQSWRTDGDAFAGAWRAGSWRLGFGLESPKDAGFRWWVPTSDAFAFAQQRQTFLFDLLAADAEDPDDERLGAALALVHDWYLHNPVWPEVHSYQWNDDVMGNRLDAHLLLADRARRRGLLDADDEPIWLTMVLQHAAMLLDPDRHQPITNHGLMQDVALLDAAVAHPEIDMGQTWLRTSEERLAAYTDRAVAPTGVFRELTPFYHQYAAERLLGAAAVARADGHPLPDATEARIRSMLEVSRWLVQPDGTMPLIADSSTAPVDLDAWPNLRLDWPEIEALRTSAAGDGPTGVRRLDPAYFVLRQPGWELVAVYGDPSVAHEQRDKLSFTLFAGGSAAIRGPGYADEFTPAQAAATRATAAQSTVVFDGKDQDHGPAPVAGERVWGDPDHPEAVAFSAESELVAGTRHRRTWLWGPAADAILVIDEVSGSFSRAVSQVRLGPDLAGPGPRYSLKAGELRIDGWIGDEAVTPARRGDLSTFTLERPGRLITRLAFGADGDTVRGDAWTGPRGTLTLTDPPVWTPTQP